MVLTVYPVISPVIGFVVTVISRIASLSAPGWADRPPQDLTPASRRQDHTTSPSASAPFVLRASKSLTAKPPCDAKRARRCRVHRIPPRVRDDREPPLLGRDGRDMQLICARRKRIY